MWWVLLFPNGGNLWGSKKESAREKEIGLIKVGGRKNEYFK